MSFEWRSFLDSYNVKYVTSGPNVSRGHVAVHCPFCGSADPSQHMSINLAGQGWRCFRNTSHRGKHPAYLIARLLNTSTERASQIVGDSVFIPEDFMGAVMGKLTPKVIEPRKTPLLMPEEFKPIGDKPSCRHAVNYLTGPTRMFTYDQVMGMTDRYGLKFAVRGPFKGRIIFPVEFEGDLVTWTGRTIYSQEELRYRTLSADPELEDDPAIGPVNDYLLWYDDIRDNVNDADVLVLCEGPFDALKVRVLGRRHGIEATCFFTAAPSSRQIDLLHDVVHRYPQRYLLLDRGTLGTAMRAQGDMSSLEMRVLSLPSDVKDPGTLTERQLLETIP